MKQSLTQTFLIEADTCNYEVEVLMNCIYEKGVSYNIDGSGLPDSEERDFVIKSVYKITEDGKKVKISQLPLIHRDELYTLVWGLDIEY